ncbi:hypothetical protein TNCV_385411 [Trichonephila clavipes]|nr:hypothetical protein TNCV_385411 [Trichonephila clavipes]
MNEDRIIEKKCSMPNQLAHKERAGQILDGLKEKDLLAGLGSNPAEDMDVGKCIVPSQHGSTLKSRQAISEVAGRG